MPSTKPRVFKNRRFEKKYSEDYGTLAEQLRFENCTFYNCGLCFTNDIRERCTVRNVWLTNCEYINSVIGCPILEDVVVDGLKINDLLIAGRPASNESC